MVDHVVTDAFGDTTTETNTSAAHWTGFARGHVDADTRDVLNGARRYDAAPGGWESKDPIGLAGGDANTSRYVGNNPGNAIDPAGLEEEPNVAGQNQTTAEDEEQAQLEEEAAQEQAGNSALAAQQQAQKEAELLVLEAVQYSQLYQQNPNIPAGEWPLGLYAQWANYTAAQTAYAAQSGCGALNQVEMGMPPSGNGVMTCWDPNVQMFADPGNSVAENYEAAMEYYEGMQDAGQNPQFFAYQNAAPLGTVVPGQACPGPIPVPDAGSFYYNYATLVLDVTTPYWQYMNNGATQGNQMVTHAPLVIDDPNEPNLGLPITGYGTTVFGVYVPPPPPPTPPGGHSGGGGASGSW